MAWYREWFGEDYLDLYAHRDAEEAERHVELVAEHLGGEPGAVLDLACGAGRHTEALRRRGYRALGLDLSLTLLARGEGLPRVNGDMGCLPFESGTFDWVLNFFTSFGYFETERQNFLVLEEIARVLAPRGGFLIDFMNVDRVLAELEPRETQIRDGRQVEIERWYDAGSRRINKRIRLASDAGAGKTYLESVRAYRPDDVMTALGWAGLELTTVLGSFAGEAFDETSERALFIGRKST